MTWTNDDGTHMTKADIQDRLFQIWYEETGLNDKDSPLTKSILLECMEASEAGFDEVWEDFDRDRMVEALHTLAEDCFRLTNGILREKERQEKLND